jgi:hypothetical protein
MQIQHELRLIYLASNNKHNTFLEKYVSPYKRHISVIQSIAKQNAEPTKQEITKCCSTTETIKQEYASQSL